MFTKIDKTEATYEITPVHRGWLFLVLGLSLIAVFINGAANPQSWFILIMGWGLGLATLLTNPKKWLTKID